MVNKLDEESSKQGRLCVGHSDNGEIFYYKKFYAMAFSFLIC